MTKLPPIEKFYYTFKGSIRGIGPKAKRKMRRLMQKSADREERMARKTTVQISYSGYVYPKGALKNLEYLSKRAA